MLGNIEPMQVDIPEENENEAGPEENEVSNIEKSRGYTQDIVREHCFD